MDRQFTTIVNDQWMQEKRISLWHYPASAVVNNNCLHDHFSQFQVL